MNTGETPPERRPLKRGVKRFDQLLPGYEECYECDGDGVCLICDGTGVYQNQRCSKCHGSRRCILCQGAGQIPNSEG